MPPIDIHRVRIFLSSQFPTFAITWKYFQQNRRPSPCYFDRRVSEILPKRARWSARELDKHLDARYQGDRRMVNDPHFHSPVHRGVFQIPAANPVEQVRTTGLNSRDAEEKCACDRLLGRSRFTPTLCIRKQIRVQRNQQITRSNERERERDRDGEREEKIGKVEQPAIQRDREGRAYARLLCMHLKRGRGP